MQPIIVPYMYDCAKYSDLNTLILLTDIVPNVKTKFSEFCLSRLGNGCDLEWVIYNFYSQMRQAICMCSIYVLYITFWQRSLSDISKAVILRLIKRIFNPIVVKILNYHWCEVQKCIIQCVWILRNCCTWCTIQLENKT